MSRKRVVFHVGLPKTGSSALQNYFSANAGALQKIGLDYPFREPDASIDAGNNSGNVVQILFRTGIAGGYLEANQNVVPHLGNILGGTAGELIDTFGRIASESAHDTVLFSGEVLAVMDTSSWVRLAKLSERFDILLVAFARDIFDMYLSSWQQSVKIQSALFEMDFADFVDARIRGKIFVPLEGFNNFLATGLPLVLLNYDTFRQDIAGAFFDAASLPRPEPEVRLVGTKYNRSLTTSESLVTIRAAAVLRNRDLVKTLVAMFNKRSDPPSGRAFYSKELHSKILEKHRGTIEKMNELILGDKLSIEPRDEVSNEMYIHPDDVGVLLKTLRLAMGQNEVDAAWTPMEVTKQMRASENHDGVPFDFDPEAYLFLNPDVAKAGVDPRRHFVDHGRGERRSYKYG